jgi:hypothetical protein
MLSTEDAKLALWICAALSILILVVRLAICRYNRRPYDITTVICIASVLILVVRLVVVYLTLTRGTANDALRGDADYPNDADLEALKLGSICAVIARLLITTFYWLQICLLLIFYSQLVSHVRWISIFIRVCWATIFATYAAVVLATFLECHPFRLYWQVRPPPGQCVRAYVQLFTQGISNIILDLMLLTVAIPVLKIKSWSPSDTVRIGILFGLGFFCIIITCLRIGYIYTEESLQPVRSFWASIQVLVSAFVVNAPTIYGCFKLIRRRTSEQMLRRASQPEVWVNLSETTSSGSRRGTNVELQESERDFEVGEKETSRSEDAA